jgi:acyl-ACP dehydrogenase
MSTPALLGLDAYRDLLDRAFDDQVTAWSADAEVTERFPRQLIEHLGRAGVFTEKWAGPGPTDVGKSIALGSALGRLMSAGIGVGVSLHDSAIAILRRFGKSEYLTDVYERAVRGEAVLCIGASEESGGSDLQIAETEISSADGGFRVRGIKKFVSLSPIADYVVVVARSVDHDSTSRHGNVALVAVPTASVDVQPPHRKLCAAPLETAAVHIDTWVPADALIARAGTGLAAISWGLAHERLSVAAQIASACECAIGVTLARMMTRHQFGRSLFEHQALRLRMADLSARVELLRHALNGMAAEPGLNLRAAAAFKVTAARLGEEVAGECLHIFGGSGFLVDETPVGRWWRDMKLARVGGGTDEILWELIAAGMKPDYARYEELFGRSNA